MARRTDTPEMLDGRERELWLVTHGEGESAPPGLKLREGDQRLPETNSEEYVQDLVIKDIEARKLVGIKRYGTALQPFNGRDALRDLYEELLDGAMYVKQAMLERDAEAAPGCGNPSCIEHGVQHQRP